MIDSAHLLGLLGSKFMLPRLLPHPRSKLFLPLFILGTPGLAGNTSPPRELLMGEEEEEGKGERTDKTVSRALGLRRNAHFFTTGTQHPSLASARASSMPFHLTLKELSFAKSGTLGTT